MRGGAGGRKGLRVWPVIPALALGGLILAACEKPPTADLDSARAALEEARAASSGKWALFELAHAQSLFESVSRETSVESDRVAFLRNFARVKALLAAARADATGAADAARREREEAKKDADAAARRARTMLQGARAAAQIAPSPRDGKADLDRLRAELHAIEMELPEVDRLITSEEFRLAARMGSELASRVETAVSRFFGRMEHGDLRPASGGRNVRVSCYRGREELSLVFVSAPAGRPT